MMPELNGLPFGFASISEKHPHTLCSAHAVLNAATSGPSSVHMIAGLVSIDRPCSAYSGNTTRSRVGMPRLAVATCAQIRAVWRLRSSRVATTGSCSCTIPSTTPLGVLLRPPRPLMVRLPRSQSFLYRQLAARACELLGGCHRHCHHEQGQDVRRGLQQ